MSRRRNLSPSHAAAQDHAAKHGSARVLGLIWYRQCPGDLLSITRGWPLVAIGAFHALRDVQWDLGALPGGPEEIRRLARIDAREWRAAWSLVEAHFPLDVDGFRRNPWLAQERYEAVGRHWQQVDAANLRHWNRTTDAPPDACADAYARALADGRAGAPADGHAFHNHSHNHRKSKRLAKGEQVSNEGASVVALPSRKNGAQSEHDS